MRGEEKSAIDKLADALKELTEKMTGWSPVLYGDLPYILGYATSSDDFRLVAIDQEHRTTTLAELSIIQEKAEALKLFYNLGMLFHQTARLTTRPYLCGLLPFVPSVNDRRTLVLMDNVIERTIKRSDYGDVTDFERLVDIYSKLKELNKIKSDGTHLQTVNRLDVKWDKQLVVELSPIGYLRHPKIHELRQWLEHMLLALKHWHAVGYCHGDLRWANILFVPVENSGYWLLIDMDESYLSNTRIISWNHSCRGETLRFHHALYQLGKLLNACAQLPDDLKDIQDVLLAAVNNPQLTAEDALAKLQGY